MILQSAGLRGAAAESMQTNASPTYELASHHYRPMVEAPAIAPLPLRPRFTSVPRTPGFAAALTARAAFACVLHNDEENG